MSGDLSRELQAQAVFLKDREPVYERMLHLFSDAIRGEFGSRLAVLWSHRTFNSPYERPLLLLAAVRYDALFEGVTHPLHLAISEGSARPDAVTPDAFAAALSPGRIRFERALRERAIQTNETTRAVAWLWPAHLLFSAGERRAIALVDLGTSAGLNLVADDLPALWVDENDAPVPVQPRPPLGLRLGWMPRPSMCVSLMMRCGCERVSGQAISRDSQGWNRRPRHSPPLAPIGRCLSHVRCRRRLPDCHWFPSACLYCACKRSCGTI
jgi:hypothetical protein